MKYCAHIHTNDNIIDWWQKYMNEKQLDQSIDFKKYIGLAISYSWLIILLPTIFSAAAYFYSGQQPKIYEARAILLVEQRTSGLSTSISDYSVSARLSKT